MMIAKIIKYILLAGLSVFILGVLSWLIIKHISTEKAESVAAMLTKNVKQEAVQSEDEKVIAIASEVFRNFTKQNPSEVALLRVRPYVTNHRLPNFLKLQSGVIETNISKGYCDNAARMLDFVLYQEGLESVQWNMVTDRSGHSALLVTLSDGRQGLVDPFYGYATVDENGKLIHPNKAMERLKNGQEFEAIFKQLGTGAESKFYQQAQDFYMAAEGQPLAINAMLPRLDGASELILGQIDGKTKDVKAAAVRNDMTPYWYYVGHKYNREWVRTLSATEPVRLQMLLLSDAEDGVLTSEPVPKIDGKKLTWELEAGDTIIFQDGLTKVSLKRMNSFIGVDQIVIQPLQ